MPVINIGSLGHAGPTGSGGNSAIVVEDGQYIFQVNAEGNLILTYAGTEAPDFYIADDGTLRLRIS